MITFKNLVYLSLILPYFACSTLQAQKKLKPALLVNEKKVIIDNQVKTAYLYKIDSKQDTVAMYRENYDPSGNTLDSTRWRNGNLEEHYSLKYVGDTLFKEVNLYGESIWVYNSQKYKDIIKEKNMTPPPKDTFSFTEVKINIDSILGFLSYIYYRDSLIFKERRSGYDIAVEHAAVSVNYDGSYSILDKYNMVPDTISPKAVRYKHKFNDDSLVVIEDKVKYFRARRMHDMFIYNGWSKNLLEEVLYFFDRKGGGGHFELIERLLFDYKYNKLEDRHKLYRIEAERSEEILEFDEKERIIYYYEPNVKNFKSFDNYEYKVQYNTNSLFDKVSVFRDGKINYEYFFIYEYYE